MVLLQHAGTFYENSTRHIRFAMLLRYFIKYMLVLLPVVYLVQQQWYIAAAVQQYVHTHRALEHWKYLSLIHI